MSIKQAIGEQIRNARIKKKKTQIEVSEATGLSRSYISDIENGRYTPSVETLVVLASYLDLNLKFLSKMTEIQDKQQEV